MNQTLLTIALLFTVVLLFTTWTEAKGKHHRHKHLKNFLRHKVAKHEREKKVEEKPEDIQLVKSEDDLSGSGLDFVAEPEVDMKEYVAKPTEEKTKEEGEKAKDHVAHIRPKKKKIHHEDDDDQGSLRNLLDSSIENLAKAGKAIQAILDATGTRRVSQTCAGSCPDVCAPGCQSTCCNTPPSSPMSQVAGQVPYPSPYQQQSPYGYPQQQQYPQMPQPQYLPMPHMAQPQQLAPYPQQPRAGQCPQQCSAAPCPSACPSTCCSSQPQYQPQAAGGMMSAPQYLELPPATPKPNITQSSSCASPCSQSCAPACQPSCCSGSMGMPMGMPFPQQQPMMPVMPQMPPTPPMQQQQACPQACQPAAPGGCAPQAQCPQRCCQNRRR